MERREYAGLAGLAEGKPAADETGLEAIRDRLMLVQALEAARCMEEGILPHHRSLADSLQAVDEERRLCYVGVTRAKRRLMLSMCLTRTKWGKSKPGRPSRFLYELTGQAEKFNENPPDKRDKPEAPAPRVRKRRR